MGGTIGILNAQEQIKSRVTGEGLVSYGSVRGLRLAFILVDDLTVPRLCWDTRAPMGSLPAADGKSRCQWRSIVSSNTSSPCLQEKHYSERGVAACLTRSDAHAVATHKTVPVSLANAGGRASG